MIRVIRGLFLLGLTLTCPNLVWFDLARHQAHYEETEADE